MKCCVLIHIFDLVIIHLINKWLVEKKSLLLYTNVYILLDIYRGFQMNCCSNKNIWPCNDPLHIKMSVWFEKKRKWIYICHNSHIPLLVYMHPLTIYRAYLFKGVALILQRITYYIVLSKYCITSFDYDSINNA